MGTYIARYCRSMTPGKRNSVRPVEGPRGWSGGATLFGSALVLVIFLTAGRVFAQAGTWTTKAPMPALRGEVAAGAIDGVLYVAARLRGGGRLLASVWRKFGLRRIRGRMDDQSPDSNAAVWTDGGRPGTSPLCPGRQRHFRRSRDRGSLRSEGG
jgi:hypothetical protein